MLGMNCKLLLRSGRAATLRQRNPGRSQSLRPHNSYLRRHLLTTSVLITSTSAIASPYVERKLHSNSYSESRDGDIRFPTARHDPPTLVTAPGRVIASTPACQRLGIGRALTQAGSQLETCTGTGTKPYDALSWRESCPSIGAPILGLVGTRWWYSWGMSWTGESLKSVRTRDSRLQCAVYVPPLLCIVAASSSAAQGICLR